VFARRQGIRRAANCKTNRMPCARRTRKYPGIKGAGNLVLKKKKVKTHTGPAGRRGGVRGVKSFGRGGAEQIRKHAAISQSDRVKLAIDGRVLSCAADA